MIDLGNIQFIEYLTKPSTNGYYHYGQERNPYD